MSSSGPEPELRVHPDENLLAAATAARLLTRLVDVQAVRGVASLVLTGGGVGIATLTQLAAAPALGAVDWQRVEVFWGDERFLPAGDPERNETQAREALLDALDLDPVRVHPMPAAGGPNGGDPESAGAAYAQLLAGLGAGEVPPFDVLLLGLGPEGHTGSIFPESPAVYDERTVVGVRGCPKPPSQRVTLTLPAMNAAREVWFVVSGESKAEAVRLALSGAGPVQVPGAGVRATERTLWLLDRAAAGGGQGA